MGKKYFILIRTTFQYLFIALLRDSILEGGAIVYSIIVH